MKKPRLVVLCTYQFASQAEMAKHALAEQGIQTFITEDNMVTADWFLGPALGWIKLQIAEEDAEAGLAFLLKHPRLTHTLPSPKGDTFSKCLSCGAKMTEKMDRCPKCGWSYLDEGEGEPEES